MRDDRVSDGEEWVCAKPGCDLDVDGHNLALAIEHAYYDEPGFTAEDAQQVADRTLARLEGLIQ